MESVYRDQYDIRERGQTTPCWVWKGDTLYGTAVIWQGEKRVGAAKVIHSELTGTPINHADSFSHRHSCKDKLCVNPAHGEYDHVLRQLETLAKMETRGEVSKKARRQRRPSPHHQRGLSEDAVRLLNVVAERFFALPEDEQSALLVGILSPRGVYLVETQKGQGHVTDN